MSESLECSVLLRATPQQVYRAWLDGAAHSAFTGSLAEIDAHSGGLFTAWDGYISGKNVLLEPYARILQTWRTSEFPQLAPDSFLEVLLEDVGGSTLVTLHHTQIPDGQSGQYLEGWQEYYFKPMQEYFDSLRDDL